ncbi:hypothetical protein [Isoptericola sp. AK164]|uniref:type IV toxin-antitoxin system AbiEi family antitoxin domain-containing protein n=1 Tax=Isoptericola sp. AK164 TaxID=3024246 RepID=UPI002418974C|nr:hypothetical protein [Isoptericola sp. AK164]
MSPSDEITLAGDTYRAALTRSVRAGEVVKVRYGAYRARADGEIGLTDHVLALRRQLRDPVFSHETAAVLLGCSLWHRPERVHVMRPYRRSGHASRDVQWHLGTVPAEELLRLRGLEVTTLARTVVDCALTSHPLQALVVADSALRLDPPLDLTAAHHVLRRSRRRQGRARARWVLDHADGGSESPWETWTRYVCLRAGMPRPITQAPVRTRVRLYRCDLGWPEHGVYVEFDGRIKYARSGTAELLREKKRSDDLREAGVVPVRVLATQPSGVPRVVGAVARRFPPEVAARFRVNPVLPAPT